MSPAPEVLVGGWRIRPLLEGWVGLDGGAMWGVVPRVLWESWTPPREDHTIRLAMRCFLAERGDTRVVIEGGAGMRWPDKLRDRYRLEPVGLEAALRELDVDPASVTHAIGSHAHWDHIGGFLRETTSGPEPILPNARHWLARVEVDRCLEPEPARRASYRSDDIEPLLAAGCVDTFEERTEIAPGLVIESHGGHSAGTCVVWAGDEGGQRAVFWSDVLPTTHHVQPAFVMAFDLDVRRSYEIRRGLFERAADEGAIGLFYHDPKVAFARIERDGGKFRTREAAP